MKTLSLFLLLALATAACREDTNGDDHEKYFIATATAIALPGRDVPCIALDDNDTLLLVAASAVADSLLEPGSRLLVNYTLLERASPGEPFHYHARVNTALRIATLPVDSPGESHGEALLVVENYWIARGFLTFKYRPGALAPATLPRLSLLASTLDEQTGEWIARLALHREASREDLVDASTADLVSFSLRDAFPAIEVPVKLRISYRDDEKGGEMTAIEITFHPV